MSKKKTSKKAKTIRINFASEQELSTVNGQLAVNGNTYKELLIAKAMWQAKVNNRHSYTPAKVAENQFCLSYIEAAIDYIERVRYGSDVAEQINAFFADKSNYYADIYVDDDLWVFGRRDEGNNEKAYVSLEDTSPRDYFYPSPFLCDKNYTNDEILFWLVRAIDEKYSEYEDAA